MFDLTIKIKDISEGKQEAFWATIPELSTQMGADSIDEIFELLPTIIEIAKKNKKGIFASPDRVLKKVKTAS